MVESKVFSEIQEALLGYLSEDHPHPDMKIFSAQNKFNTTDVAFVIQKAELGLSDPQKEYLTSTFLKRDDTKEVPPPMFENYREKCRRERKEILNEFKKSDLSVQEFLEKFPMSSSRLKSIIGPELWAERFKRKREIVDYEALVETLKACKGVSIQDFCSSQGIALNNFRNHCPKELWEERYEKKRTYLDWPKVIQEMKDSGLSYQEFCYERGIVPAVFKGKAGEEICKEYDKTHMKERLMDKSFKSELSIHDNAEAMGIPEDELEKWVFESIRKSSVSAFTKKHSTPGKLEEEIASLKVTIGEQKIKLEEKNKKICDLLNQARTTENQLSAQKAEKYRLNNKVEEMKAKIAGIFAEVNGKLKAFQAEIEDN